jgi:hypothetical protein
MTLYINRGERTIKADASTLGRYYDATRHQNDS